MDCSKQLLIIGCLFLSMTCGVWGKHHGSNTCGFPAIYVFGDSNSDTGAASAAFASLQFPNGETFFGSLSGRFCDGRLIIDYITEELELPYLDSYLNSLSSNYRHGANFAVGGANIIHYGGFISPFDLGFQIDQFKQFKYRTNVLYNKRSDNGTKKPSKSVLPRPDEFSRALYILDVGQNDLSHGFNIGSDEQLRSSIPNITETFYQAVQQLYNEGARIFWIHGTGPYGCLPYSFISYKSKQGNLDANGCVKPHNEIALEFNRQLKGRVFELRKKLSNAKFTYVDMYAAKYKLISDSKKEGFVDPMLFCCGTYSVGTLNCGAQVNGAQMNGSLCKNASEYISWDSVHYTQAANLWVAKHILSGSFSNPPLPIGKACL